MARGRIVSYAAAALGGACAAVAGVTPDFITITATNSLGTGSVTIPTASVPFDSPSTQTWISPGTFSLMDGPNEIGRVGGGTRITIGQAISGAYAVSHAFFYEASAGLDTIFTVTSGVVDFPIQLGVAGSGSMTLTDSGGGGATLTGLGGSLGDSAIIGLYTDFINGPSTLFEGVDVLVAPPGGSNDATPINVPLTPALATELQLNLAFMVTGGDSASGTSTIVAIPEPAVGLLMLGGLALLRRR